VNRTQSVESVHSTAFIFIGLFAKLCALTLLCPCDKISHVQHWMIKTLKKQIKTVTVKQCSPNAYSQTSGT